MDPNKIVGRTDHDIFLQFGGNSGDEYDDREKRRKSWRGQSFGFDTMVGDFNKALFFNTNVTSCEV